MADSDVPCPLVSPIFPLFFSLRGHGRLENVFLFTTELINTSMNSDLIMSTKYSGVHRECHGLLVESIQGRMHV